MARNASGAVLQVRVSGKLHSQLEAFRAMLEQQQGEAIPQSAVVRLLLEQALGNDAHTAAVEETMRLIYARLNDAMNAAREAVDTALLGEG